MQTLLVTLISEYTDRFLQTERGSIVQLVTLVSFFGALLMVPKLVRMLQRGDTHFNSGLWKWCMGIGFTLLFPSLLSQMILKKPLSEVTQSAPITPVLQPSSGYVLIDEQNKWKVTTQTERNGHVISPFSGDFSTSELGPTVINPKANPANFGIDLLKKE